MPQSGPTIRATILARFDAFIAGQNVKVRPLLSQVGLRPNDLGDPDRLLSLNAVATLLDAAARRCNDPCFGLHYAEFLPAGSSGILGHLVLSAPTVRDAIQDVERYVGLLMAPIAVSFSEKGGRGVLSWRYPETFSAPKIQFSGLMVGALIMRLQKVAGPEVKPLSVELDHRPFECADEVRRILGSRVRFDRPGNLIAFDSNTLNRRTSGAQPGLHSLMRQLGDRVLEEQRQEADIVELTRRQIAARLKSGAGGLDAIADAFGLSARALQGRLKRGGTTFETLVGATRQQLAESYLRDTGLSMTEIAMLLGFSELSAFTRASQRWFNMSPSAYRVAARRQRPMRG
jgi:AraC-like DNA-binding protein